MSDRIQVRVDYEIEKIISTHKRQGEAPASCLKRLIKIGAEQSEQMTAVRSDFQRVAADMRSILETAVSEQRQSNDRLFQTISKASESSKLSELSGQIAQQVADFASSVKGPFKDISDSLNSIRRDVSSLSDD